VAGLWRRLVVATMAVHHTPKCGATTNSVVLMC
jgi:hypothetical protein